MTISIIIIYLIHQSWLYFVDTYSEKKVNRIIDNQIAQYKEIIENLQSQNIKNDILKEETIDEDALSQDLETFLNTLSNT